MKSGVGGTEIRAGRQIELLHGLPFIIFSDSAPKKEFSACSLNPL